MYSRHMLQAIGVITLIALLVMVACEVPGSIDPGTSLPEAITSVGVEDDVGPIIREPEKNVAIGHYEIGPGVQNVQLLTGASPPFNRLRFVMAGPHFIVTQAITVPGAILFEGVDDNNPDGVAPSLVTRYFAQNPIPESDFPIYNFNLVNRREITQTLRIVAIWDRKVVN